MRKYQENPTEMDVVRGTGPQVSSFSFNKDCRGGLNDGQVHRFPPNLVDFTPEYLKYWFNEDQVRNNDINPKIVITNDINPKIEK